MLMSILNYKNKTLQVLISTMNRSNLEFLESVFVNNNISNSLITIINQTKKNTISCDNNKSIQIFNSSEFGLSYSRNLAIKNSTNDYCLFADDDVVYVKNFDKIIISEFYKNPSADIITFQMKDDNGNYFKNYPNIVKHNLKSISSVNSVVIAFKRKSVINNNLNFNTLFGLGSYFQTGEEYIFLRDALNKKLNIFFCEQVILSHKTISSGKKVGNNNIIFARAAIFFKYYSIFSLFKLFHHILLLYKLDYIKFSQIIPKYFIGLNGILKYIKSNDE